MIEHQDCRWVTRELSDYLGDGLAASDRRVLEEHIVLCPPCRAHLAQMRAMLRTAARIELDGLSIGTTTALTTTFREWARRRGEK